MRSGSTIEFISTILPPETVKPMTATGCPLSVMITPAAPFTSTGRFGAPIDAIASVWRARFRRRAAPRKGGGFPPLRRVYEVRYHDTSPLAGSPPTPNRGGAHDGGATVAS